MKKPELRCLQLTSNKRIFFTEESFKEINKNNETLKRDSTYTWIKDNVLLLIQISPLICLALGHLLIPKEEIFLKKQLKDKT